MSELKAHKAYNRWLDEEMPTPNDDLICNEVYLKSEADKVIARQKFKRCLAMASRCFSKSNYHFALCRHGENAKENNRKSSLYLKWRWRWLAIAEKIKEAK